METKLIIYSALLSVLVLASLYIYISKKRKMNNNIADIKLFCMQQAQINEIIVAKILEFEKELQLAGEITKESAIIEPGDDGTHVTKELEIIEHN